MKEKLKLTYLLLLTMSTASAQWSTTGNSGLTPPTNFLGTNDGAPLMFKVGGTQAGFLDNVSTFNSAMGINAMSNNSTGYDLSAFGAYSLYSNISGYGNSAFGRHSLSGNHYGNNNVAMGLYSLSNNYSGNRNISIGNFALALSLYGDENVAVGHNALGGTFSNTKNTAIGNNAMQYASGDENVAVGFQSLYNNEASYNTALGNYALKYNLNGTYNTATGYRSLYGNIYGTANTASGHESLYSNGDGVQNTGTGYHAMYNNVSGSYNTAAGMESLNGNVSGIANVGIGYQALYTNTLGRYNTAIGDDGLFSNYSGQHNIAIGSQPLFYNYSGYENVALGSRAIISNISGSGNVGCGHLTLGTIVYGDYNVAIGHMAGPNGDYVNSSSIGKSAIATASNSVMIGSTSVSWIGGYASWTNLSDGRVKKNVKGDVPGLVFIKKLNPVTYTLDLESIDQITKPKKFTDTISNRSTDLEDEAKLKKEKIVYTGFIAQDVAKAASDIKYDFSGVALPSNDKDLYGIRYSEFVVPLVKAVQELSGTNDSLQSQVDNLKQKNVQLESQIADILKQISEMKALQIACCPTSAPAAVVKGSTNSSPNQTSSVTTENTTIEKVTDKDVATMEQNIPNPFSGSTVIKYHIPVSSNSSQIRITDSQGNTIKDFATNKGSGQITLRNQELSAGIYYYSLFINNKIVETKRMILTK